MTTIERKELVEYLMKHNQISINSTSSDVKDYHKVSDLCTKLCNQMARGQ